MLHHNIIQTIHEAILFCCIKYTFFAGSRSESMTPWWARSWDHTFSISPPTMTPLTPPLSPWCWWRRPQDDIWFWWHSVQDYHGWTGDANDQMVHMPWKDVANTDDTPFIVVTTEGMDDIAHGSHGWGSWNVSNSEVTDIESSSKWCFPKCV